MAGLLDKYTALGAKSARADVARALKAVEDAPLGDVKDGERLRLIEALLDDLRRLKKGKEPGRLASPSDAAHALAALKALGKHPAGARAFAQADTLGLFLALARDGGEPALEALRCVANTMLLVEGARATVLSDELKGGDAALALLEKSSAPDTIFLACRILFLATVSPATAGPFIVACVEERPASRGASAVDVLALRIDTLLVSVLAGTKMAREAMTDLLKFAFNLLVHYRKIGECATVHDAGGDDDVAWSERLDVLLPALLRAFNALPPSPGAPIGAPLSHVIHALIEFPITSKNRAIWLGSTPSNSGSGSPSARASPPHPPADLARDGAKPGALDRALGMLAAGRRSLSSRPSSPSPPALGPPADTPAHGADLLEHALAHYLPGAVDPDDASVKARAAAGGGTLDELLCPLVMLLMRVARADAGARARLREWIVPPSLDRSAPLLERGDALGRALRLLQCVYHPRMKAVVGEMLFAFYGQDPQALIGGVGYGAVAGFLFNKGIMSAAPSGIEEVPEGGAPLNPITGAHQAPPAPDDMTEEEREAEAERLFALFDRLERTGAIPASANPVRQAMQRAAQGG